jgi:hypothetical protein
LKLVHPFSFRVRPVVQAGRRHFGTTIDDPF